jgi:hypothetical protein
MIYSWFVLHKIIFVEVQLGLVETLICRTIGSKFYVFQVHKFLFPWFILSLKVIIFYLGLIILQRIRHRGLFYSLKCNFPEDSYILVSFSYMLCKESSVGILTYHE